jgi:hypothetical protein
MWRMLAQGNSYRSNIELDAIALALFHSPSVTRTGLTRYSGRRRVHAEK